MIMFVTPWEANAESSTLVANQLQQPLFQLTLLRYNLNYQMISFAITSHTYVRCASVQYNDVKIIRNPQVLST